MTFLVTGSRIRCKHTECVDVWVKNKLDQLER